MSDKKPPFNSMPKGRIIDPIHYTRRTIETAQGPMQIEGITVRALRSALESMDPDSLVAYMAEQGEGVTIGIIGGAVQTEKDCVFLVGPELSKGLKAVGMWPPKSEESNP